MTRIAIISDTHISDARSFSLPVLKSSLEKIRQINPFLVIHLGDITQNGTLVDYEKASSLFRPFQESGVNIKFIPGNHDGKNLGHELFPDYFGPRTFNIIFNDIWITGLDSTVPDRNDGRIGRANRRELEKRLNSVPDHFFKVVCVHHHLIPVRGGGRERSTLSDAGDVLEVLQNGKCDLIITGHRHTSNINTITTYQHNMIVMNSGTLCSTKTRGREGHAFYVLEIDPVDHKFLFNQYNMTSGIDKRTERFIHVTPVSKPVKKVPKARIVQIANTHFSASGGVFRRKRFFQGTHEINSLIPNPEAIVHCGDITDSGREKELDLAREALMLFDPVPVVKTPGTNDWKGLGIELFEQYFNDVTGSVLETEHFVIKSCNSCLPGERVGNLGRRAIEEIKESMLIAKEKGKLLIVVFHHLVVPGPHTVYTHMLEDAGEVLHALAKQQNAPVLALTGQYHVGYAFKLNNSLVVNTGTFSSSRVRSWRQNTYNIIDIYDISGKAIFIELKIQSLQNKFAESLGNFVFHRKLG
ncbi:MAG: metallophosphoesterase family protein [Candidatus Hodarchaeales archaeon]